MLINIERKYPSKSPTAQYWCLFIHQIIFDGLFLYNSENVNVVSFCALWSVQLIALRKIYEDKNLENEAKPSTANETNVKRIEGDRHR